MHELCVGGSMDRWIAWEHVGNGRDVSMSVDFGGRDRRSRYLEDVPMPMG
jgi:hypothetical protein